MMLQPWNYFDSLESIDADAEDSTVFGTCVPDYSAEKDYVYLN